MSTTKKDLAASASKGANGTNGISKIDSKLSDFSVAQGGEVESKDTPKVEMPLVEEKKPVPTIEQKLKKFDELDKLLTRRGKLQEAIDNIGDFHISQTGSCNLKFTDSNNLTFGISHPIIIGEIVHSVKEKLRAELDEVERLFDFNI